MFLEKLKHTYIIFSSDKHWDCLINTTIKQISTKYPKVKENESLTPSSRN